MRFTHAFQFLNASSKIRARGGVAPQTQAQAPEVAKQTQAAQTGANNGVPGGAKAQAQPPAMEPRGSLIDITV